MVQVEKYGTSKKKEPENLFFAKRAKGLFF